MEDIFTNDLDAISRIESVKRILEVVCRTTGLGFSAVARVTDTRWIACAVRDEIEFGLKVGGELKLETTICNEIRASGEIVAIDHVEKDEVFCNHHTPKLYGFQSYISVPIHLPDGNFFGTLCAIDPRPFKVKNEETIGMFKLFADLIAMHLDAQHRLVASESALMSEREAAQLREQFIAVLGHDLRNPLSAVSSGVDVLGMLSQESEATDILKMMKRSVSRMAGLIDDVLDFARGRLGGGLSLRRVPDPALKNVLKQVVNELQTAWPKRSIVYEAAITEIISCDSPRIGQMLSNLLANALTHGDPTSPVWVRASTGADGFNLSVTNNGQPITSPILANLFKPFSRGVARPGQQGLGLGLYIASEIAKAHEGTLTVTSHDGETCFRFQMSPIS